MPWGRSRVSDVSAPAEEPGSKKAETEEAERKKKRAELAARLAAVWAEAQQSGGRRGAQMARTLEHTNMRARRTL